MEAFNAKFILVPVYAISLMLLKTAGYKCDHGTITRPTLTATPSKLINWPGLFGGYDHHGTNQARPQTNSYYPNYPAYPQWPNTKYPPYVNVNVPSVALPPLNINTRPLGTNVLGGGSASYGASGGGGHGGFGGYGGYGGNGGLSQYYGYWQPSYEGQRNRGYGYYPNTNYYGMPTTYRDNTIKDRPQYAFRGYD